MALNKEKVQDLIDDFVVSNVDQINEVATANPMVYDAVINALNLLSRKFGTIQAINIPKPAAPIEPEKQKANALHPSVQMLEDFVDIKGNETRVGRIDYENEEVTFFTADPKKPIKLKFSVVNDAIEKGGIKLKAQKPKLNPLIKVDEKFIDKNTNNVFIVKEIINLDEKVRLLKWENKTNVTLDFSVINDLISRGDWVTYTQTQTPKLNPLVEIGSEFSDGRNVLKIEDIDYDKEVVVLSGGAIMGTTDIKFNSINYKIESGQWELKTQPTTQSNTFGALTLNPSVQVGQKYIDLEDDSNFSVLLIDQKKQVVTIYWNEDDVQGEVDFEDFNDNLEAATWVLAPDQAQGGATEAEILDAIEGLELIGDAISKKEIAELKKQLKQLKKKKP